MNVWGMLIEDKDSFSKICYIVFSNVISGMIGV